MKLKQLYTIICTLFLIMVLATACGRDSATEEYDEPADTVFRSQANDLFSLTICSDGEVFAATRYSGFSRFTYDGELTQAFPGTEGIHGLYYYNGLIYGYVYDRTVANIVEIDPTSGDIRTVYSIDAALMIPSLVVSNGHVVMVIIPEDDGLTGGFSAPIVSNVAGLNGINDRFISVNIATGEFAEFDNFTHPISLYKGSSDNLYVYAHTGNDFALFSFDIDTGRERYISNMGDVGNIFSFAFERNVFVFNDGMGVSAKRMSDGLIYNILADRPAPVYGGTFTYFHGNLVFLDQSLVDPDATTFTGDEPTHYDTHRTAIRTIRTIRLDEDFAVVIPIFDTTEGAPKNVPAPSLGAVTISASEFQRLFSVEEIRHRSGITAVYLDQPFTEDEYIEFLASIMAGDDTVDIYILWAEIEVSHAMRTQGGFVPLTQSDIITSYLNSTFDWVREIATAPDGEIWMLPLFFEAPILWYVPENFANFDLTPADLAYFYDYLETVAQLNLIKDEYVTLITNIDDLAFHLLNQYNIVFNYLEEGILTFDSSAFAQLFDNIYGGFNRIDSNPARSHHPVLQYDHATFVEGRWTSNPLNIDTNRVIFSLEPLTPRFTVDAVGIANWRALPMPRISPDVTHNYVYTMAAIINPASNNQEFALAFLEAAAYDMLTAINRPVFVIEDPAAFEGHFDMTIPVFQDLHNIFREAATLGQNFPTAEIVPVANEFQADRISLAEAVEEIQRRAEFWLHE